MIELIPATSRNTGSFDCETNANIKASLYFDRRNRRGGGFCNIGIVAWGIQYFPLDEFGWNYAAASEISKHVFCDR
ncbi:hypothetical protein JMK10_02460 [Rhodovulum sulfidophilum]|uniref:hypothetical protein n=1 Tax=Rhodovulum sulfidophilum TaxID=35806 RepID=UPI001921FA9A|nr:hypothetical protein [Rhodovulum sulfidophilum]MBL3576329.1 hypothetical protein [Rhodovulum sulfidophilum]MCF4115700.1 hypothetical protein [Rhodovulum sulfidophilum]